ncbi:hypothetical protein [[Mycoplasma] cavipharyngis]
MYYSIKEEFIEYKLDNQSYFKATEILYSPLKEWYQSSWDIFNHSTFNNE